MGRLVSALVSSGGKTRQPPCMQVLESRQMFSVAPAGTHTIPPPINPVITQDPLPTDPPPTNPPPTDPPPVDPPPVDPPPVDPPPVDPPPVDPPPVDPPPVIPAPHFATDAFVRVVHIGPTRDIKTLKDVKWPGSKDAPTEFILDYSKTPYVLGQYFLNGKLWIEPADWDNRPTLQLANTFKKKSKSSNSFIAGNPSLNVNGTLIIRGMNTIGGEDSVLLGSGKTGNIDCEDVQMDGGGVWRGSGGNNIYFQDNESLGIARANVYSSYTNPVHTCVIDNSGTDVPVLQGGRMVNGNAIGEAAIRIMNVDDLTLIGVKTTPWFYKPGKAWKQDVQLRPSSKHITVIGCDFYKVDIGDMTWRKPAHPIDKVDFIDCTLAQYPSLQLGIAKVTLTNCMVNGKKVTKALK